MPRLGGAGIVIGMGAAWLAAGWSDRSMCRWPLPSWLPLLCIAPAVIGGIVEDVTQRVSVRCDSA